MPVATAPITITDKNGRKRIQTKYMEIKKTAKKNQNMALCDIAFTFIKSPANKQNN